MFPEPSYIDTNGIQMAVYEQGEGHPVILPEHIDGMKTLVSDLEIHMLENCGHWSQQEKPGEVNDIMLEWLMQRG